MILLYLLLCDVELKLHYCTINKELLLFVNKIKHSHVVQTLAKGHEDDLDWPGGFVCATGVVGISLASLCKPELLVKVTIGSTPLNEY